MYEIRRVTQQINRRYLSASAFSYNAAMSSCKAGTVLNLKMKKSGDEPVALEDAEYPEWLWDCLDKQKLDEQLKESDIMKWRRRQISKKNNKRINNNNFLSQMK